MAVRASYMAGRKRPIGVPVGWAPGLTTWQDLAGTRNTTNPGWGTVAGRTDLGGY
ncbi:hypothetical protein P4204_07715 [Pseudomonas aeruginosa]|nr:hypothetical protein [Pseudomonas aeruginosa]